MEQTGFGMARLVAGMLAKNGKVIQVLDPVITEEEASWQPVD